MIKLIRVTAGGIDQHLQELAELRITVFRDFPYLYDGDLQYEQRYLKTYSQSAGSVVVLALDNDRIVGASTALPMAHETTEVKTPFEKAGFDVETIYYFGESVLLSEYRGQGIGVGFFEHREAHARETGNYQYCCFCAVQRPADHPDRPQDYQPLDSFWQRRGFQKRTDLTTHYSWKDLNETTETPKPMMFWLKELR